MELLAVSNVTWVVVLLIAAALLLLVEVITPTLGILGAAAIGAAGGAVIFAFRIHWIVGMLVLIGCLIGLPVYLYLSVKILPNTPLGRRLFLKAAPDATNDATPESKTLHDLIGKHGTAVTTLRPSGEVKVDGRRYDARAEYGLIESGQTVEVIRASGTDVVVRPLDNAG
jgi:membrane-bound serine protease (ClpP class)